MSLQYQSLKFFFFGCQLFITKMTTKLSHPYKDHPEPWKWDNDRIDEIEEIYEW